MPYTKAKLHDAESKLLVANCKKQEATHFIFKVQDQIEYCNHLISTIREKMATFQKEFQ
jgi:hypothetical protein